MTSTRAIFRVLLLCLTLAAICSPIWADGSKLVVGDIVSVVVDGEKEFTKPYQINKDGNIVLPMVEPVKLVGMNTSDASAAITQGISKVLVNPQVTVTFVDRAKMEVFVVGRVKSPGLVSVGVGDRIVQALAQAGYDDTADLSRISVQRGDQVIKLDLTKYLKGEDLSVNAELNSGDTVVVPQIDIIGNVSILGQVEKPGAIPLKRGTTFRDVLGMIGGVGVEADTDKITVRRQGSDKPIPVDYAHAMDGDPAANVELQPGDTIYIPQLDKAFFTVIGAVNKPGQYPVKGKLTLSEAIGLAGGVTYKIGDMEKVRITQEKAAQSTEFNLKQVLAKTVPDPLIQRGDVVFVKDKKQNIDVMEVVRSIVPFMWLLH